MSNLALILFCILCPCISYIIVKRMIIPWTGGVYLVMGDDKKVLVDFSGLDTKIQYDSTVKGIFLSGARANMMPSVSLRRFLRCKTQKLSVEMVSHYLYEGDDGVYQMFCRPMEGSEFHFFLVDVYAPYPWRGHMNKCKNGYYAFAQFDFAEVPKSSESEGKTFRGPAMNWN